MGMGNVATSGMQASMSDMEVISNNIANASTVGFKKSSATFADIFPAGGGAKSIGLGVNLANISQDFTATGSKTTGIPSNLCINSSGFFMVSDATTGQTSYARNGAFTFVQAEGLFKYGNQVLQGFVSTDGVTIPAGSSPTDLVVSTSPVAAVATTTVTMNPQNATNLSSNDTVPSVGAFSAANPNSYNFVSNSTVYDSLGNANAISLYYVKNATLNTWEVYAGITPPNASSPTIINPGAPGTLTFGTDGALTSATGLSALSFSPTTGAASPQSLAIDFTGATQFGTANNPGFFAGDGREAGTYAGYTIDKDGNVNVSYSNGETVLAGQVAVASFTNPQALSYTGNSTWSATTASGPAITLPSNSVGNITSGALEMSNVDLAQELVNLINAQNTFQANAQVVQTYNQVMQTVTKL